MAQEEVVKPYNQEEGKKQQVQQMFDSVAHKYDALNRFLSLRLDVLWRRKTIKLLAKQGVKNVLDVATGTADIPIEINKQLPKAQITGLDLSNQMLEHGRVKVSKKGLNDKITLVQGDSENLPFDTNSFDAVTATFGVRNYENLEKGLSEMLRVTAEGGYVYVLEFSKPTMFPFKQVYNFYFKYILPVIGKLTSKDPKAYKYLFESVQSFPCGEDFLAVLRRCGYSEVRCIPLTLGVCSIYIGKK